MNTQEYLAEIRSRLSISTDYAIAKALGVSKQAAGNWSKGKSGFDDETARRVAAILDIHPGTVILDMHRERAQSDETRDIWMEIARGFLTLLPHAKTGWSIALPR